jgi:hypothetical protein
MMTALLRVLLVAVLLAGCDEKVEQKSCAEVLRDELAAVRDEAKANLNSTSLAERYVAQQSYKRASGISDEAAEALAICEKSER